MFLDHGPVVPFAMAGLSIEGYVQDDGDDRAKTNYLGFRFGAGAHIFLADSFSLDPRVELGASPRAGLMLFRAAKALAALHGRDHVLPDDVQALAPSVLSHRLLLAPSEEDGRAVVTDILRRVPAL